MAMKEKKTLTPEEKLKQALVPVEEQPYPVPENWCWTNLQTVCATPITDGTHKTPSYCEKEEGFPFISAKDVTSGAICWNNIKYITRQLHEDLYERLAPQKDDILLAKNGTTGIAAIVDVEMVFDVYVTLAVLRPDINIVYQRYLLYLINSPVCKNQFDAHLTGIGVPNLHLRDIKVTHIPLPPLAEQHRIVSRIESLFAKLDEAKEAAQAVVDGFEDRKAAILHKAFTGELTAEWREKNGLGLESWKQNEFDDCVELMQNGIAKRKGDSGEPFAVLRLANLNNDGFVEDDLREILLDEKEQKNYRLQIDDVLMIRVNGSKDNVGKQYQVMQSKKWAFCDHLIRIRYVKECIPAFMVYFSKSENYRQYIKDNMVSSAGQNTISRKGMVGLEVPVPLKAEQEQIVAILKNEFEKEQRAKDSAEAVLDQIDTMKKSILARAFRGGLGTNDPNDEPAIELLKRVLEEKV